MHIDFTLTNGTKSYLSYSFFKVGPASSYYKLSISGYSGIVSKDLPSSHSNGRPFTTKDKDNDQWDNNCAVRDAGGNAGGWWYYRCSFMFPNHQYKNNVGIYLNGWKAMNFTEVKIRPINCII